MSVTNLKSVNLHAVRRRGAIGPGLGGGAARHFAFAAAYVGLSYLLLLPILRTYVIADDFEAPFAQMKMGATGVLSTLNFAWQTEFVSGDRTRVVGGIVGALVNWLWLWVAKVLGISILDVFGLIRFFVIVACAMAVSTLWWQTARTYARPISWRAALVLVSVALFGTLQLHGIWSNDPVESYPMAGYASAAIGFGLLALAVWTNRRPTPRRFALLALSGMVAVSYYEFNLGAVAGAVLIVGTAAWPYRRDLRRVAVHLAWTAAVFLVPVAWMLIAGAQNSGAAYNGRQLQASGAVHSLLIGVVSSLPGAAWHLTSTTLGGYPALTVGAVVVAILVVGLVALWLRLGPSSPTLSIEPTDNRSNLMLAVVAVAVVVYAVFAIGLEGATQKVELEVTKIGQVYTAYAVGSAAVGFALAVGAWWIVSRGRGARRWLVLALALLAAGFITVQGSYNEHLKDRLQVNIAENQALDNAFAAGVSQPARCSALRIWMSYPWPDYYRQQVLQGTEVGYRDFYGRLMCPSVVAPSDGFGPENGPVQNPQWWLLANSGSIFLRTPNCSHGCRGTLYFSAGGFAVPHQMKLGTQMRLNAPMRTVARLNVPDHWAKFAVPIRLSGTYATIAVTASGRGVTPASVHVGTETIPEFVDFTNVRFVHS